MILAVVTTRFVALHCWPNAPAPVEYLRNPHRHEFHVTVKAEQSHDDRDVEFITLKREVEQIVNRWHNQDVGSMSCEMMATYIALQLSGDGWRVNCVSVFEDGENGAEVIF